MSGEMDCESEIIFEDEKSDGEVSSDSDDIEKTYIPLERPSHVHETNVIASKLDPKPALSDKSDSPETSSDSDTPTANKRMKLKPRRPTSQRPNKYAVWNATAQEDLLTENMINCDMTAIDRSRDVETYDYPKRKIDLKRRNEDRKNVHLRLGKRNDDDCVKKKGTARYLNDLVIGSTNTDDEIASEIAKKLSEEKDDLLKRIVEFAGKDRAIELFKETQKIEEDGGMLVMNQTRRRTPGGIYFFLVKHDTIITDDQKRQIFREEKQVVNVAKRRKKRKNRNKDKKVPIPNLITQAEIELSKGDRSRKEAEITEHVSNPPPSPVTDGKENSSDETTDNPEDTKLANKRDLAAYDDEFLEITCGNEMDFFS